MSEECALTSYGRKVADELARKMRASATSAEAHANQHGLRKLGEGDHRTVFEPKHPEGDDLFYGTGPHRCVLKVVGRYTSQNENEIVTWERAPESVRKVLVPVTDYDPQAHWLVMPKVQPGGLPGDEDRILDVLSGADWTCEDMHHGNYGRYAPDSDHPAPGEGRPVMLDYGFKCYPKGTDGEAIYEEREGRFEEEETPSLEDLAPDGIFD